ncbi:hypothetical protein [Synechococcus sp. LTW-R]|uniref:hypothetical protein n=1 Tax=Synechococcus sp. LTW-R TaxID=2751170 RepID=UPI0016280D15|nr:hypothetical protein [Synechococcus sp. LTW-R]QNG28959.1 hypothetical protein H0O22_09430 [Synechococcus sp. LTW-R]
MLIWVDSEDGSRGGSVYLKRCHQSALDSGKTSKYIDISSTRKKIKVILSSWWSGNEIRGTVPREIPTLIWCKNKRGYIQSPPEEWSICSRIAMRLFLSTNGCTAACVSRTTRDSAKEEGFGVLDIEYARIQEVADTRDLEVKDNEGRKIVFIVMDNGLIDKGYLRHLSIIDAVSSSREVVVEVYGAGGNIRYGAGAVVRHHGYKSNPFDHAAKINVSNYIFYLGCSRFEGLHMAVVEAAIVGIPSILSDIQAHRELQSIAGEKLLIGSCVSNDIEILRNHLDDKSYRQAMDRCGKLAKRFKDAGNERREG